MDNSDDSDFCENEKVAVIQGQSVKRVRPMHENTAKTRLRKRKETELKKLLFQQNRIVVKPDWEKFLKLKKCERVVVTKPSGNSHHCQECDNGYNWYTDD